MLYGFGVNNPPHAKSAGVMLNGGISNGITGSTLSPEVRSMTWAEGPMKTTDAGLSKDYKILLGIY